jgi:hypothetical protein
MITALDAKACLSLRWLRTERPHASFQRAATFDPRHLQKDAHSDATEVGETRTAQPLVHPVVPPHVDDSLTPAGNKFAEAVALLCEWAVQNKALLKQVAARGTH